VVENCAVQQILNQNRKVVAVGTSRGMIECQYFVNCGGFWARRIGKMSEPHVKVPLHACEHYYLHTKPIAGLDPMTPGKGALLADSDASLDSFQYSDCVVLNLKECVNEFVISQFDQRANYHTDCCYRMGTTDSIIK
jgi:hypothetical protein